jgi:hypothetical protein
MFFYKTEQEKEYLLTQQSYVDLAENQFWIFNNETLKIDTTGTELTCPASGLFWVFNLKNDSLKRINLIDISKTQIEFAEFLWKNWDGVDYGEQVISFIKYKNIKHFQLDDPNLEKLEQIKLKNHNYLKKYINSKFVEQCTLYNIENFKRLWDNRMRTDVAFAHGSIIDSVLSVVNGDIWISNILDYKYNFLKYSAEQLDNFKHRLGSLQIR